MAKMIIRMTYNLHCILTEDAKQHETPIKHVIVTRKEDEIKTTPLSLLRASLKDQGEFLRLHFF